MTRGALVLVVAVVVTAVVTDLGGLPAGLAAGGLLALVGVALGRQQVRGRVGETVRTLHSWREPGPAPRVRTTGLRGDWRPLSEALDELAAVLDESDRLLDRERSWRRELVRAIAAPALLFDLEGHLVSANEPARRLLRLPADDVRPSAIQATGSAALAEAVRDATAGTTREQLEVRLGTRVVAAGVSTIGDGVLLTLQDRSEQVRVDDLRRNFVVNASHELKTPATSIQTLAEALELTLARNPARVGELVGRLRDESERLVNMVHDLLSLRRLEDQDVVDPAQVDLAKLTREVIAELLDAADRHDIELELHAPEELVVTSDPDDLRLVVRNLVANAIQYNRPDGTVTVTISADPVRLVVDDTGIGIPQQDLERVFERFYRVDVARSRKTGGTGLGLSITRHALERNGGTIAVTSLVGSGTTFTVTLPDTHPSHGRA